MLPSAVAPFQATVSDEFTLGRKLGEGTYGDVYDCVRSHALDERWKEGIDPAVLPPNFGKKAEHVAVKIVKAHKDGTVPVYTSVSTLREIKLLRELHHPNLIFLEQVILNPGPDMPTLALVYERADFDLRRLIRHERALLNDFTVKSIMYQMLLGIHFLHENWVVHRDLKPQNVLICRQAGLVKIGDFGLARLFQAPVRAMSLVERVVVTLWYRAPELLLGARHYTTAVDMWALGCMFAEIILGHELFCGTEVQGQGAPFQSDQCSHIFRILPLPSDATWPSVKDLPHFPRINAWRSERKYQASNGLEKALHLHRGSAKFDLISKMLTMDPDRRITAREALDHPYFLEAVRRPRAAVLVPSLTQGAPSLDRGEIASIRRLREATRVRQSAPRLLAPFASRVTAVHKCAAAAASGAAPTSASGQPPGKRARR